MNAAKSRPQGPKRVHAVEFKFGQLMWRTGATDPTENGYYIRTEHGAVFLGTGKTVSAFTPGFQAVPNGEVVEIIAST